MEGMNLKRYDSKVTDLEHGGDVAWGSRQEVKRLLAGEFGEVDNLGDGSANLYRIECASGRTEGTCCQGGSRNLVRSGRP